MQTWESMHCVLVSTRYKLGVITCRCLYSSAPRYLAACCISVSTTASRQHLSSDAGHQLVIPSHQFTTYGRLAFSVAGLMFWNSLPRNLRDPLHIAAVFGRSLKHFFSQSTSVHSASEAFATMRYINWSFTYLLTYQSGGHLDQDQSWNTVSNPGSLLVETTKV